MKWLQIISILFISYQLSSQDLGQIVIGKGNFNSNIKEVVDYSQISTFLSRELSNCGLAYSESDGASFVIDVFLSYGYVKELDINGIPMLAAEIEFDFSIRERHGGISFESLLISIAESGENTEVLLRNALKQLRKKSSLFQNFLTSGKSNITAYYQQNCDRLIAAIEQKVSLKSFDQAILLAGQIPSEVSCYDKANEIMLKAYNAKQTLECKIIVQECMILADQANYDAAYEKALLIPKNSACHDQIDKVLDAIADRACEQYVLKAEAYYANKNFEKAIDCLIGLETVSKNCGTRKLKLESKMKAHLDAVARQNWELKIKKYNDSKAERKAKFDQEVSIQNRNMTMKERQLGYAHVQTMKKMDHDATIRAKELEIAPELEKYRTRRDIEISKNERAVESLRIRETASVYRALLK